MVGAAVLLVAALPVPSFQDVTVFGRMLGNRFLDSLDVRDAGTGAKCDGVTDDTVAFQAAFAAVTATATGKGRAVLVPAGRCMVSATLTLALVQNQSVSITGRGQDISELFWTSDTDGITVTETGAHNSPARDGSAVSGTKFAISGVSLVRQRATTGHTALLVNGNADNNNGNNSPVTQIRDVSIHGSSLGGGWTRAIDLYETATAEISDVALTAGYTVGGAGGFQDIYTNLGDGISIRGLPSGAPGYGCYYATDVHITNVRTTGFNNGTLIGDCIQGVSIVNMTTLFNNIGFVWLNTAPYQQDGLWISNSNFNDKIGGIQTVYLNLVTITGSMFLNALPRSPWAGITTLNTFILSISGNVFQGRALAGEYAAIIGADGNYLADLGANVTITGNTVFSTGNAGFNFTGNVTNILVDANSVYTLNNDLFYQNDVGASNFQFGTNTLNGVAYTGSAPNQHGQAVTMPRMTITGNMGFKGTIPVFQAANCGTGPVMDTGSTNSAGGFTEGTTATGCVVLYAAPGFQAKPICQFYADDGLTFAKGFSNNGLFSITHPSAGNRHFTWSCVESVN